MHPAAGGPEVWAVDWTSLEGAYGPSDGSGMSESSDVAETLVALRARSYDEDELEEALTLRFGHGEHQGTAGPMEAPARARRATAGWSSSPTSRARRTSIASRSSSRSTPDSGFVYAWVDGMLRRVDPVTMVSTPLTTADSLTFSASYAYWIDGASVLRSTKTGVFTPEMLGTLSATYLADGAVLQLAATDDFVVFTNGGLTVYGASTMAPFVPMALGSVPASATAAGPPQIDGDEIYMQCVNPSSDTAVDIYRLP